MNTHKVIRHRNSDTKTRQQRTTIELPLGKVRLSPFTYVDIADERLTL